MWSKILVISLIAALAPSMAKAANLFGVNETAYQDLSYFPKWTGMLQRSLSGQVGTPGTLRRSSGCKPNPRFLCPEQEWEAFVKQQKKKKTTDLALLKEVNAHLNKARYVQDPINWGVPDFWAHLREFFQRNGDCEDYAISKYATLKRLGIPSEGMRIVVLEDLNLNLAHAVLTVDLDGRTYVLDNQISAVLADTAIHHYKPVYSINEHGWWMHRSPQGQ
jgi:predicted transglutaminase-like cysteine proteinase